MSAPTHLALAIIVQFDGVFLELRHEIVGRHETEVLVAGCHLEIQDLLFTFAWGQTHRRKLFMLSQAKNAYNFLEFQT